MIDVAGKFSIAVPTVSVAFGKGKNVRQEQLDLKEILYVKI